MTATKKRGASALRTTAREDPAIISWVSADKRPQWSPARNPYAIAVSQSWWTLRAVLLFAADAKASTGETQQIYARQILGQLRMLLRWAVVLADELARLRVDQVHRDTLLEEIAVFESAVAGAVSARNILEHLDDYARGDGRLQRNALKKRDIDVCDAAAMFWGGGYDPSADEITEGPFAVSVPDAVAASQRLHRAIYRAARAIDAHGGVRGAAIHPRSRPAPGAPDQGSPG